MAVEAQQAVEKIKMVYTSSGPRGDQDVELPFRVLVLANFTGNEDAEYFEEQTPVSVSNTNFNLVMARFSTGMSILVDDKLREDSDETFSFTLKIKTLNDFSPQYFISQIPELQSLCQLRERLVEIGGVEDLQRELGKLLLDTAEDKLVNMFLTDLGATGSNQTFSHALIDAL